MTPQRREILRLLGEQKDHPTANELYSRAQRTMPSISLATVYNSLEALSAYGLVREVHFDRESTRYCANAVAHGHFHDQRTGEIRDIPFKQGASLADLLDLPPGVEISAIEITLRGKIPDQSTLSS